MTLIQKFIKKGDVKIMSDTIRGKVLSIADGDTFDMTVTHVGKSNEYEYGNTEIIRTADSTPEIDTEAGKKAKEALEKKLNGKEVRVTVSTRDKFDRIVGTYEIL